MSLHVEYLGEWTAFAACAGKDQSLWFPPRGVSTEPAKAVCAACPVRDECLEHALSKPELVGVWGGYSERQRRGMRSARLRDGLPYERFCPVCMSRFRSESLRRVYCCATCKNRANREQEKSA